MVLTYESDKETNMVVLLGPTVSGLLLYKLLKHYQVSYVLHQFPDWNLFRPRSRRNP